jgi:hypothetical protein
LGEQLILQLSVTHSIKSPANAPVSGAAARAAGDKFCGTTCPVVGGTTIVVGLPSSNRLELAHPARTRNSVAANSRFIGNVEVNNSKNTWKISYGWRCPARVSRKGLFWIIMRHMIGLTDTQLKIVMNAARLVPVEKRDTFLQH